MHFHLQPSEYDFAHASKIAAGVNHDSSSCAVEFPVAASRRIELDCCAYAGALARGGSVSDENSLDLASKTGPSRTLYMPRLQNAATCI